MSESASEQSKKTLESERPPIANGGNQSDTRGQAESPEVAWDWLERTYPTAGRQVMEEETQNRSCKRPRRTQASTKRSAKGSPLTPGGPQG
ncbi:hypothetical protein NDU88_005820 [Pleurodeles waltl]|uniref:Uncharacterized protein n=1 Tax=Pleurodeles waltl TaxID=8319 RepID=A0AAV7SN07_PLEWA|nr:hypothetical protein NDU88_005820 [Pleurodeles waltl]